MKYIFGIQMLQVVLLPGVVLSLRLLSNPDVATQGEGFTLSCVQDFDLLEATWIRYSNIVFNTKSDIQEPVVSGNSQTALIVLGRITVSTSLRQHNVTLRINSTLDDGSVWECRQGGIGSNQLTINVMQHTTVVSTPQTTALQTVQTTTSAYSSMDTMKDVQSNTTSKSTTGGTTEHNDDTKILIYIVIGSVVGAVVVSVIIVTVVCVIRKKRNQTAQTKYPMPKEHSSVYEVEDGVDNSEMIENVLYCGYSDPQYSTDEENRSIGENKAQTPDETRVTDVYAQVQKKRNRTEVQVSVNIEDLYAKPVKKKSTDTDNVSVNNNVTIHIRQIADEDV